MLLGSPLVGRVAGVVGERRGWEGCAGDGKSNAVGACRASGVEEVDGVHSVAAAALGEVEDVVEYGDAAEVIVFADFVSLVAELGNVETTDWGGDTGILCAIRCPRL